MSAADWTPAWLWLAVIASGIYHGVNPGMGWPLAVSAGLMERSPRALLGALGALSAGLWRATLLLLLLFPVLLCLAECRRPIRLGAILLLVGFGIFRLVNPRH